MDIGLKTEFKVKLTPKVDKAVYRQTIDADPLERRPNCRTGFNAQVWNYHSSAFLQFRKLALHKGSQTENYVFLWISGKSTVLLRLTILT